MTTYRPSITYPYQHYLFTSSCNRQDLETYQTIIRHQPITLQTIRRSPLFRLFIKRHIIRPRRTIQTFPRLVRIVKKLHRNTMRPQQRHHIIRRKPLCRKRPQNTRHRPATTRHGARSRCRAARRPPHERLYARTQRTCCYRRGGCELDDIRCGDGVLIRPREQLGADGSQAGVFGARAFRREDEAAVAAVVDAVVEGGADGAMG